MKKALKHIKTAIILKFVSPILALVSIGFFIIFFLSRSNSIKVNLNFQNLSILVVFILFWILLFAVSIAGLVYYIVALCHETNFDNTHDILLLIGFFVPLLGLVGLFFKLNYFKEKMNKQNLDIGISSSINNEN